MRLRLLTLSAIAVSLYVAVPASAPAQVPGSKDCLRQVGPIDVQTATVEDIQHAMAAGELTSRQLVEGYLARIAFYEGPSAVDNTQDPHGDEDLGDVTNSIRHLNPNALAIADQLDAERAAGNVRGPLHGIPVLLKDNIGTADMPTTAGSIALEGHIPEADAPIVADLREAGAIILGKVNLSEFANWVALGMPNGYSTLGGQVHSAYTGGDPSGSSSGSGVAAALALSQLTIGSETSGSILSPSTVNGIVGVKPTIGLVSRGGIIPLAPSFDTAGPMVRNVTDAAYLLSAISNPDGGDITPPHILVGDGPPADRDYSKFLDDEALKGVRLGVNEGSVNNAAFEAAIAALQEQGATIVYTDKLQYSQNVGLTELAFIFNEFKASLNKYLAAQIADENPFASGVTTLSDIIAFNARHPDKLKYGQNLLQVSDAMPGVMNPATDGATLATTIASARAAIEAALAADDLDAILTSGAGHANIGAAAGYPTVTVPAGYRNASKTQTFNLSFLGTAFSEARLISYAYDYEQATNLRVPPTELEGAEHLPSSC